MLGQLLPVGPLGEKAALPVQQIGHLGPLPRPGLLGFAVLGAENLNAEVPQLPGHRTLARQGLPQLGEHGGKIRVRRNGPAHPPAQLS